MRKSSSKYTACFMASLFCAASLGLAANAAPHGRGSGAHSGGNGMGQQMREHRQEMMENRRQEMEEHRRQFRHPMDDHGGGNGWERGGNGWEHRDGGNNWEHHGWDNHGAWDRHEGDGWGRPAQWNHHGGWAHADGRPESNGVQNFSWKQQGNAGANSSSSPIAPPPPASAGTASGGTPPTLNTANAHLPSSGALTGAGNAFGHLPSAHPSNPNSSFSMNGQPVGESKAWENFEDHHPRRAEVLERDNHLNNEIQADKGNLGGHYNQLEREAEAIKQQEQADAMFNGGYITKGEQRQLNHEENHLQNQINRDYQPQPSTATSPSSPSSPPPSNTASNSGAGKQESRSWENFEDHHPRRAEVLERDNKLNNEIQADKGDLGGHYNQLEREAEAIKQQEQADAMFNGGYITKGEQRQLNHEENELQRQIYADSHANQLNGVGSLANPNGKPGGNQTPGLGATTSPGTTKTTSLSPTAPTGSAPSTSGVLSNGMTAGMPPTTGMTTPTGTLPNGMTPGIVPSMGALSNPMPGTPPSNMYNSAGGLPTSEGSVTAPPTSQPAVGNGYSAPMSAGDTSAPPPIADNTASDGKPAMDPSDDE